MKLDSNFRRLKLFSSKVLKLPRNTAFSFLFLTIDGKVNKRNVRIMNINRCIKLIDT